MIYHRVKPLPPGISYASDTYTIPEKDAEFLYDLTYQKDGKEHYDQSIFNEMYHTIEEADDFLVLDLFLVNGYTDGKRDYPKISEKLVSNHSTTDEKETEFKGCFY